MTEVPVHVANTSPARLANQAEAIATACLPQIQSGRVLSRTEVPVGFTWDLGRLFLSVQDWERELLATQARCPGLLDFRGRLHNPPDFIRYMQLWEELWTTASRVHLYAELSWTSDTRQSEPAVMLQRADELLSNLNSCSAFEEPELIALGAERLRLLADESGELSPYRHKFEELARRSAHVGSPEIETLLAQLEPTLAGAIKTYSTLTDSELSFGFIADQQGVRVALSQGNVEELLMSQDQGTRRMAWQAYADGYLRMERTLTQTYLTAVNQSVFVAEARRYSSSLEAALASYQVPPQLFDSAIRQVRAQYPLWQRYFKARAAMLGVPKLKEYDLRAPLTPNPPVIPYEHAVELVCQGLSPLGDEYVLTLMRGLLRERWADVLPTEGKYSNPFSQGTKGTYPYMLLRHANSMTDVGTIAHEGGHSMHTKIAADFQPMMYMDYSMAAAEVASNFNQALVRAHLLSVDRGEDFSLAVLDEAFYWHHRYLFMMPILAQFERQVHAQIEQGGGYSAEDLRRVMTDLLSEAYGDSVEIDPQRSGIAWAQFSHVYEPFYSAQYVVGIVAADALAWEVLHGKPGTVKGYLNFLRAGASLYPVDALKLAGIDMTEPAPFECAFSLLEGLVERLENAAISRMPH